MTKSEQKKALDNLKNLIANTDFWDDLKKVVSAAVDNAIKEYDDPLVWSIFVSNPSYSYVFRPDVSPDASQHEALTQMWDEFKLVQKLGELFYAPLEQYVLFKAPRDYDGKGDLEKDGIDLVAVKYRADSMREAIDAYAKKENMCFVVEDCFPTWNPERLRWEWELEEVRTGKKFTACQSPILFSTRFDMGVDFVENKQ